MIKRIAVFEDGSGFGGAVFSLMENIRNLSGDEFEFVVVHSLNDSRFEALNDYKNCYVLFHKLYNRRCKLEFLDFLFERLNIYLLLNAITSFFILLKTSPDLVYTNNDLECNLHAIIAAKLLNFPVVAHERDIPGFWSKTTKLYFNTISKVIAVSEATKSSVKALGFPEKRIVKLLNSINNQDLLVKAEKSSIDDVKIRYQLPFDKKIVLMIGMLTEWKGQHILLEAAQILNSKRSDLHFVFVGEEPTGKQSCYLQQLQSFIGKHHLEAEISLLGFCADVAEIINSADIVIHASISPEPFGRVIIESMALAKPVIATNIGGLCEIIQDGSNGFLVTPGDAVVLAEKINELSDNVSLVSFLTVNAQRDALELYDSARVANELKAIFNSVLS